MLKGLVLIIGTTAVPALAATISITNPSFEAQVLPSGNGQFVSGIEGWTSVGNVITWHVPSTEFATIPDGVNIAAVGAVGGSAQQDFYQTLSVAVQPNTTYTLTYYIGWPSLYSYSGYVAALYVGTDFTNAELLASQTDVVTPTQGGFIQDTLTYTSGAAPPSGDITVFFADPGIAGAAAFDLVQLSSVTHSSPTAPEPGTWAMLAGGAILLAGLSRSGRFASRAR
jgi:hypothetical protein